MTEGTDIEAVLDEIHSGLADDGVYVHPDLASTVTEAQLDAVRDNLAQAGQPTFVVIYPLTDGDAFSGSPQDLLVRLTAEHPVPGTYYSTTTRVQATSYSGVDLEGYSFRVPGVDDGTLYGDALGALSYEEQPTVGDAAERLTDLLLLPPAEQSAAREAARDEWCENEPETCTGSGSDGGSGPGGAGFDATGIVVAVVVAVVVVAALWMLLRRTGRAGNRSRLPRLARRGEFVLPAGAMGRVREAHDRRLEQRTRDELLALGERIERTPIGPTHDRAAWQAALDHYDAARWALAQDDDPDVLDVVGALVLTRRGVVAFEAATAGRTYTPAPTCYLNPLHGEADGRHTVTTAATGTTAGERRSVPVCAGCRAHLEDRQVPDILDVQHDGEARHYFETDVEPWATTGYGSLDPDLVTAVQRSSR